MRRFAFLQCVRCSHFHSKKLVPPTGLSGPAFASAAYVGICSASGQPEWIVWKSLEWAASDDAECPDRTPLPVSKEHCSLYDVTPDSASKSYPSACVYHDTPLCPKR